MKKSIKSQIGIALEGRLRGLERDLEAVKRLGKPDEDSIRYFDRSISEVKEAKEWLLEQRADK